MKIFHTADWHIGKIVNAVSMIEDQRYILTKLIEYIDYEMPEVLIIAGDVYDRSIPPVEAVKLLEWFLEECILNRNLKVIMSSGNHDSGERLSFGNAFLKDKGLYIVGDKTGLYERIDIKSIAGDNISFYVMPYLSPFEARHITQSLDIKNADELIKLVASKIKDEMTNDNKNVFVGHGLVMGLEEPEKSDSERPLTLGGLDYISYKNLVDFDYVALGHLHNSQRAGEDHIRYSGSLLKYSFSESQHQKGILCADLMKNEYRFLELEPIRDMRIIKGPIEKLISEEIAIECSREDYIHAILTDRGEIADPISILRSVYPNVLSIERQRYIETEGVDYIPQNRNEKNPIELFSSFFEYIEGSEMDENEKKLIEHIADDALRGDSYEAN